MSMKKLLWIGDCGCPSGFARATHETLATLHQHYDVYVLAMNFRGDGYIVNGKPDSSAYPDFLRGRMWACAPGGDSFGVGRMIWMCDLVHPDVIVIQQDGWNFNYYTNQLRKRNADGTFCFPEYANVPVVAVVAVDGKNFQGGWLTDVALAVFWTHFGLDEARAGGYKGPAAVIPLGVDLSVYKPGDRIEARRRRGLPAEMDGAFIVGNANRNQPRKRFDLSVMLFADWVYGGVPVGQRTKRKIDDAWLYLHTAPTGDVGVNIRQLAQYCGVLDRLALMEPPTFYGVTEDEMRDTYNCMDVLVSTTQGEGMGLTAMEAMACGVACELPDWAAFGEWARDASLLVPCTSTQVGPPYQNVIGGVVDRVEFVMGLDRLYRSPGVRERIAAAGLARMQEPCFRWPNIGAAYVEVLGRLLTDEAPLGTIEPPGIGKPLGGERKPPLVNPGRVLAGPGRVPVGSSSRLTAGDCSETIQEVV